MRTWFSALHLPTFPTSQPGGKRSTGRGPCVFGDLRAPSLCPNFRFKTFLLLVAWPGLEPQMPTGLPAGSGIHSCAFPPRTAPQPCAYGREAQCPWRGRALGTFGPMTFPPTGPFISGDTHLLLEYRSPQHKRELPLSSPSFRHKTTPSPPRSRTFSSPLDADATPQGNPISTSY